MNVRWRGGGGFSEHLPRAHTFVMFPTMRQLRGAAACSGRFSVSYLQVHRDCTNLANLTDALGGALCTCTMTSDVKYYRNPASSSCTVTLGLWTPDSRSDLTQSVESLRPYCLTQRLASVHTTPQPDHFEITTEDRYRIWSQADPTLTKSHWNPVHFQSNKGCCTPL